MAIDINELLKLATNSQVSRWELDNIVWNERTTNRSVLIDFLNSLLSNIGSALGGINSLEAVIDEITNTVIIIDKNPLPNRDDLVIPKLNEEIEVLDMSINEIMDEIQELSKQLIKIDVNMTSDEIFGMNEKLNEVRQSNIILQAEIENHRLELSKYNLDGSGFISL